jgi:Ca-activated chloride channel family protein
MSFRWPELLWAVLLVPLALLLWLRGERRRRGRAGTFGNPALLPNMLIGRPGWRRVLPVVFYLLTAAVLLAALARPEATAQVPRDQATVMLVMDTSVSMAKTDVPPTRSAAAQEAAGGFLDQLPDRFRVGLVTFATHPTVQSLPTTDREAVRTAMANVPVRGSTAVGDAVLAALLASRPANAAEDRPPTAVLLLTDGASRRGVPPLAAAEQARQEGVPVFTIAFASQAQDADELRQVAELSGGQAFTAPGREELAAVYRDLSSRITYVEQKRELTSWFMGGAAALLLLGAAASIIWFRRIP